jgi:S-methylmethionine-dependent homocysteine/selenocysteine methylase
MLTYAEGRKALTDYYLHYISLAQRYQLNFVLETPTWRASSDWGYKMGYSGREMQRINELAVTFTRGLQKQASELSVHALLSGNIGPRGDGYQVGKVMTSAKARDYHSSQIRAFAAEGVHLVTALTMNYSDEAIGIVEAAKEHKVPVAISFTVETDGRLPNGETLQSAIEKTDQATGSYAAHFMINCAHPEHFKTVLRDNGAWKYRIRGIRANASTKSHAELDDAVSLDAGDKCHLASDYRELMKLLPELKVIGGCCGTDHSHIGLICRELFAVPTLV